MQNIPQLLEQALHLADEADAISMKHYRSNDLVITTKPDSTPVTQADTDVESRLNDIVINIFKNAYLGEEGINNITGDLTWIVDPIDGTKSFLRNYPVWATLIAVTQGGETLAAVVSAPALGKRWWASKGNGAFTNDVDGSIRQIKTSAVSQYADAFVLYAMDKQEVWSPKLMPFLDTVWRHRSPGDFYNYMFIAEGSADATFESGPKLWDIAAPKLIVEEAGGKTYQIQAQDIPPDESRDFIATNGILDPNPIKMIFN